MRLSDIVLCVLLSIVGVAGLKGVLFQKHEPQTTLESPLFRETLARSLNDFKKSDTVVNPYEATLSGAYSRPSTGARPQPRAATPRTPAARPATPPRGAAPVPQPRAQSAVPEAFTTGLDFFRQRKLEEAAAAFKQSCQQAPNHVQSFHLLGHCYLYRKMLDEAIEAYQGGTKADPKNSQSYHYLGNAYRQRGDVRQAERAYGRAIALNPNETMAHVMLGEIYAERGQLDMAREQFGFEIDRLKAMIQTDADNPMHVSELARFYIEHAIELAESLKLAKQAAAADPKNNQIALTLVRALQMNGEMDEAEAGLKEIIKRETDDSRKSYYNRLLSQMQERVKATPLPMAPETP